MLCEACKKQEATVDWIFYSTPPVREGHLWVCQTCADSWRKNDAIFSRVLAGCSEDEFMSLRCPLCGAGLGLSVHPGLHTFFVRCIASPVHLGRHGEIDQAPAW